MAEEKKKRVQIEIYESTKQSLDKLFEQYQQHKKDHPNDKYDLKFSDNYDEWVCQVIDSMFISPEKLGAVTNKFMSSLQKSLEKLGLGNLDDLAENLEKIRDEFEEGLNKEKPEKKNEENKDVKN